MSGHENGLDIDLKAAVARDHVGDVGVPASADLLAFTNAVELGRDDVDAARHALAASIGDDATLEAAAIIAIFNGLVRVADGTGIQLDSGVFTASIEERDLLDINSFGGAANSADVAVDTDRRSDESLSVHELFG